jgi:hypothetical protein
MSSSNEQETRLTIDRREALMRVTALLGGAALVGSSALWEACSRDNSVIQQGDPGTKVAFSPGDVSFLDEVADTILPDTKTPGAKAAKVGAFMTVMVNDCYDEKDQKIFKEGLAKLDDASKKANGAAFMSATPAQRLSLLEAIDKEAKTFMDTKAKDAPTHYFRMMKELTLLGYFTSQIGCTQAQRYIESPGRLDPCVPYKPGDRAWAGNA